MVRQTILPVVAEEPEPLDKTHLTELQVEQGEQDYQAAFQVLPCIMPVAVVALARMPVPVELVVRDVYSVHGNLDKPRRAVEIARREIDRFFPPVGK